MFSKNTIFTIALIASFLHLSNISAAFSTTAETENDLYEALQINLTCSTNGDCLNRTGNYSVCYQSKCICWLGYLPNSSGACAPLACVNNTDCTKLYNNTICGRDGRCACDSSHQLNEKSEICDPVTPHKPMPIAIPILIIVSVALVIGGVAVYMLRIQKRRSGYN